MMKHILNAVFAATLALAWLPGSAAQPAAIDPPVAGQPCPKFTLEEIHHFEKTRASLEDFKGQWLILDFWTTGCSSCVASFPKINRLQKAFKDRIRFILVGKTDDDRNKDIRKLYERFREKQGLELAAAFNEPLFQRWEIHAVPRVVIVDPQGIVYAVTDGRDMDEAKLEALLAGNKPAFYAHKAIDYDHEKPLLFDGNGGTPADLLYGSMLTTFRGGRQAVTSSIEQGLRMSGTRFQATGLILDWLYNYAYFGRNDWFFGDPMYGNVAKRVIREVADETPFKHDFARMENLYSYSANLSPAHASVEQVQRMLRHDLAGYFGYTATVEKRRMPYWKLTATPEARRALKTRGEGKSTFSSAGGTLVNVPISRLLAAIWGFHQLEPPFVDETGITGHVDITLDAILTDLDDVRRALRTQGLDLVMGEREMDVIVVRDAAQPSALSAGA